MSFTHQFVEQDNAPPRLTLVWEPDLSAGDPWPTLNGILAAIAEAQAEWNLRPEAIDLSFLSGAHLFGLEIVL